MSWLGAPTPPGAPTLRHRRGAADPPSSASAAGPSSSSSSPARRDRKANARPTAAARSKLQSPQRSHTHQASLSHARGLVQAAFRQFGEHCARNQIRTLLIDCLVMTNLFYPSFAMFLERHWSPASGVVQQARGPSPAPSNGLGTCGEGPSHCTPCWLFNGGLSETIFPPPPPLIPNVEWGPWWSAQSGAAAGDAQWVPSAVGSSCSDTSVELLRVAWADVGDVLDAEHEAGWTPHDDQIVASVRSLADHWESEAAEPEAARCVRHLVDRGGIARAEGPCYTIAPRDADRMPGSTDLAALWGRKAEDEEQMYRGLIIPFHKPSNISAFEAAWSRRLAEVMAPYGAEVFTETYAGGKSIDCSTIVSFSPSPPEPAPAAISATPPTFVFVLYGVLFVALLYQLSNATKVHSRFGLAFTGIVQLCCSTVMSFSVLALLGWNGWGWSNSQTVLPTYTLPFVIVVVGAENMSALTKAVFSVPFTYSVPVRIGIGLSKVGSTIALTSLVDLSLLGLVWLCVHLQPVREFCVFAAVVIVTDWFMLHTFFLTVLSIDAQRLELADVLASNGGLSSAEVEKREEDKIRRRASRKSTRFSWRSVLRARTAKSGSLLLLLTSLVVLYYYTEPGRRTKLRTSAELYGYKPTSTSSLAPSARPSMFATTAADLSSLSVSESLWRSLNPQGLCSVRIMQPPSSIVVFPRVGHSLLPADIRKLSLPNKKFKLPRLEPVWYWVKMGLLPQAATSFALYGLLLYLLKDSTLLDAQRNRLGRGGEPLGSDEETDDGGTVPKAAKTSLTTGVGVHMLPASHESDVDVIATSADGRLGLSIGVDNSICIWRFADDDRASGTREMVPTAFISPGDPIVAAAVSSDRQSAAIVTRSGQVQLWSTPDDDRKTEALGPVHVCSEGIRAVALAFDDSPLSAEDPFIASPTGRGPQGRPTLLVATSDGAIQAIAPGNRVVDIAPPATKDKRVQCRVDILATNTAPIAIVSGSDQMTMWRKEQGEWSSIPLLTTLDETDRVTAVANGIVDWQRPIDVIAIGRRSGRIEVFDADGERIAEEFGQDGDPVRNLAIAAPTTTKCSTCDSRSTDGFFIVSSTVDHVYIDRILPRRADAFCRCPPPPRRTSAIEDTLARTTASPTVLPPSPVRARTTSGGFNRLCTTSPMKGGGLAPPTANSEFPISSHGARRLSGFRESNEIPRPPSPLEAQGSYTALSSLSMSAADDSISSTPARTGWDQAEVVPLGAVVATDGGWSVLDHQLIGVRRAGAGIDDSQWHLWIVDLRAPWNGSSLLVEAAGLDVLERRTRAVTAPRQGHAPSLADDGEMPMRARRAERILSLNGRASFPSPTSSFTVPTHQPLGYVAVRPFRNAGRRAVLAGFGNRIGVVTVPAPKRAAPLGTVPTLNLPPRSGAPPSPAPRVVTPRRPGFPAPPPRRADAAPNSNSNPSTNPTPSPSGQGQNGASWLQPSPKH